MKTGFRVHDCMTTKPVVVKPSTTIQEIAAVMDKNHVGSILVEENGEVLGIVSEQDIVRKAVSKKMDPATKVSEIMEKKLITIDPSKDIYEAITIMRDYNIRHLPVMDNEVLTGLITSKDILKIEPQLFDVIAEKIELKEQNRKPISERVASEGICEICGKLSQNIKEHEGSKVCDKCRGFV